MAPRLRSCIANSAGTAPIPCIVTPITNGRASSVESAKSGTNYWPQSGTLTFGVGEVSKSFTVSILDDGQFNGDRSVALTLSRAGGGGSLGLSAASLVIQESDPRPVPLVTVLGAYPLSNRKGIVTGITLAVSAPLDPASASNVVNYRLVQAGRGSRFHPKDSKKLPFRSAIYGPGTLTITLTPRGRFTLSKPVRLTVSGLFDASGRAVDGDRDGQPGGELITGLRRAVTSSIPVRAASNRGVSTRAVKSFPRRP